MYTHTRIVRRRRSCVVVAGFLLVSSRADVAPAQVPANPNSPGIMEPALAEGTGVELRIPHTDQAAGDTMLNVVGSVVIVDAEGALSLTGHVITDATSPNRAMQDALEELEDAADDADLAAMTAAATELKAILLGATQGRIYDGFAMLNYNRGAFVPDHVPGEYKMKVVTDSGLTAPGMDGQPRKIWEVTVNMLWYDAQFDSDTFLLRVPVGADSMDTLRVHYRIYSLVKEDFSPTTVMMDVKLPGSAAFPFKGFDSVWTKVGRDKVAEITVDHPPLRLLRGVYTWGWREHPPRIHFLQPIFEMVNAHTGLTQLEPQGESFAYRNRQLTIADIGDAAPEKKMYTVAQAVLAGASPAAVLAMLTEPDVAPRGTWEDWADLAEDQTQLPPEAVDVLTAEGIPEGQFGPYRYVSVYLNDEMYGDGPNGEKIEGWLQGDKLQVKVINLDKHTHYFRSVDFGPKLHDDIDAGSFSSGSHSFEIFNFKPTYGAPKVAEMQWRAGWGFRPHYNVLHQHDVFPRPSDNVLMTPFVGGFGNTHSGYRYSAANRQGDFRFNPPPFIIGTPAAPSPQMLSESDGTPGLLLGQLTEGYGVAKMCSNATAAMGEFCPPIPPEYNPHGALNFPPPPAGMGPPTMLRFPPFLRNPNAAGGDIIPPTTAWKPFLWINPNNGTLFIDPANADLGYWADRTYAHGTPIAPGGALNATVESPRAAGQIFYQFDDLYHDNAIFSPHATFTP